MNVVIEEIYMLAKMLLRAETEVCKVLLRDKLLPIIVLENLVKHTHLHPCKDLIYDASSADLSSPEITMGAFGVTW